MQKKTLGDHCIVYLTQFQSTCDEEKESSSPFSSVLRKALLQETEFGLAANLAQQNHQRLQQIKDLAKITKCWSEDGLSRMKGMSYFTRWKLNVELNSIL